MVSGTFSITVQKEQWWLIIWQSVHLPHQCQVSIINWGLNGCPWHIWCFTEHQMNWLASGPEVLPIFTFSTVMTHSKYYQLLESSPDQLTPEQALWPKTIHPLCFEALERCCSEYHYCSSYTIAIAWWYKSEMYFRVQGYTTYSLAKLCGSSSAFYRFSLFYFSFTCLTLKDSFLKSSQFCIRVSRDILRSYF